MTRGAYEPVCIVTGAARGLGRAFSIALASSGARIALVDKTMPDVTAQHVSDAGAEGVPFEADVAEPDQVEDVFRRAWERFGRIEVLVNNAGIFPTVPLEEMSFAQWSRVLRVNMDSVFLCTRAVIPPMKQAKYGRIVNIASTTAYTGPPGLAHYSAAKAGIIGFTRAAANELGRYGITVNAIAPGLTLTEGSASDPALRQASEERAAGRAIRKVSRPEDLVSTLLYLIAPDAHFVTGQTISVNGGELKL